MNDGHIADYLDDEDLKRLKKQMPRPEMIKLNAMNYALDRKKLAILFDRLGYNPIARRIQRSLETDNELLADKIDADLTKYIISQLAPEGQQETHQQVVFNINYGGDDE